MTPQTVSRWQSFALPPAWVKVAIYTLGMTPAAFAFYYAFTDQLGTEPVRGLEKALGIVALRFLVIGLAITPLRKMGGPNLIRYRRAIGLVAFYNAALHLFVYVGLDQNLEAAAIWKDIIKRPYITVGFLSFLILVPLAITSTNAMIKRLGAQNWQRLHKWVYLASAAACIHFVMLKKTWQFEPLIYAAVTAALLLWRVWDKSQKPARARRA